MKAKKILAVILSLIITVLMVEGAAVSAAMTPGDRGSSVTAMQKKLIALGYMTSSASGSYNTATKSAVKLFESLNNLTADGVADDAMLARLDSVYNGAGRITVKASLLAVRSGAGTKYSKLGTVKKGASFVVIGTKKVSGVTWYKFKYGTKDGWVCGSYVTYTAASGVETVKTATIKVSTLNVRTGAGTKYSKAGTLKKGAVVIVTGSKTVSGSTWYSYSSSGRTLWFSGKYATIKSYIAYKEQSGETTTTATTTTTTAASENTTVTTTTTAATTATTTSGTASSKITTKVQFATVTTSSLNLRKGAGTSYAKVATAAKGSKYAVLGSKTVSGTKWYNILYKGSSVWACGTYLSISTTTSTVDYVDMSSYITDKPNHLSRTVVINDDAALLYADAGSTKALMILKAGVTYSVCGNKGYNGTTWYKLNVDGVEGYISRYNVTVTNTYLQIADRDFSEKAPVIYLSPSKQGANSYITGNTTEKAEMEALADVIYEKLQAYDCVVYIAPKTMELYDRAQHAYSLGADIYIAIHSNATASSSVSYGPSAYYFPGCAQSKLYAQSIVNSLNNVAPLGSNLSAQVINGMKLAGGFGYAEVREPGTLGMIGVLVETDFHDYAPTALWLINEKDEIADAYVESLVNAFGLKLKDTGSDDTPPEDVSPSDATTTTTTTEATTVTTTTTVAASPSDIVSESDAE